MRKATVPALVLTAGLLFISQLAATQEQRVVTKEEAEKNLRLKTAPASNPVRQVIYSKQEIQYGTEEKKIIYSATPRQVPLQEQRTEPVQQIIYARDIPAALPVAETTPGPGIINYDPSQPGGIPEGAGNSLVAAGCSQYTASATTITPPSCAYNTPGYIFNGSFIITVVNAEDCAGTYTINAAPVAGSGPGGSTPPITTVTTYIGFPSGNFLFAGAGPGEYTITVNNTNIACTPTKNPITFTVIVPDPPATPACNTPGPQQFTSSSVVNNPACAYGSPGYLNNGSFVITVTDAPACAGTYTVNATPVTGSAPDGSTPPSTTTITYIGFPAGNFNFAKAGPGQYLVTITNTNAACTPPKDPITMLITVGNTAGVCNFAHPDQFTGSATSVTPPSCPVGTAAYTANGSFTVTVVNALSCAGTYTVNAAPIAGSGPGGSTPAPTTVTTYIGFPAGNFFFGNAGAGKYLITITNTNAACSPIDNPIKFAVTVPDGAASPACAIPPPPPADQFTASATTVLPTCAWGTPGYLANGSFTVTVTNAVVCAGTYTINATPIAGSGPLGSTPPLTTVVTYIGFPAGNFLFANAGVGQYTITVTNTNAACFPPVDPVIFVVTVGNPAATPACNTATTNQFTAETISIVPPNCQFSSPGYTHSGSFTVRVTNSAACAGTYTINAAPVASSGPGGSTPPTTIVTTYIGFPAGNFLFAGAGPGQYRITVTNTNGACAGIPTNPLIFLVTVPDAIPANVGPVADFAVCNNVLTAPLNFTTTAPGTVFRWTNSNPAIGLPANGNGNLPAFNPVNAGITPITATITVTPYYDNGGCFCNGTPITFVITVNPTPLLIVTTPATQTICSGNAITTITHTGNVAGTVFNWTRDNGDLVSGPVTGIAASGSGDISGTLINTTNAPVTVNFTITPSYTNAGITCTGPALVATVTVNPIPNAVATPSSQAICTGSAMTTVSLTGNVAGTVFNWTRDKIAEVTGIAANGTGNTISGTLTNTTGLPQLVTFTITPSYTNAGVTCTGTPIIATVVVNTNVSGDINTPGLSVCAGNGTSIPVFLAGTPNFNGVFSITVLNGPGVPTAAFNWISTVNGPTSVNIPAANLTNTGTTPATYQVNWVSLTDANGCPVIGLTGSVNITVYPVPTIQVSAAPVGDVCPGSLLSFSVTNPNAVPGATFRVEVRNALNALLFSESNVGFTTNYLVALGANCSPANPLTYTFTPVGPGPQNCTGIPVTRQITQRDAVAPSLITPGTLPGGNLGNTCLSAVPAAPTTTAIRNLYTDNCTSTANLTVTLGTTITTGNNCGWTVTYPFTVTDACGNTTAASVTYTGADTQAPTWTTTPASLNRTVNCSDAAGLAAAQALVPVATDNCANAGTLSTNTVKTAGVFAQTSAGTCTSAGTITNTFTTHDGCGNVSAVYTQVITITDNVGPVLSSPTPQTLDVGNAGNCTAILPDYRPLVTATDCTPVTMTQSPAPGTSVVGSVGPGPVGGSVIVTITATDGCGNVSTRNITVNLVDVTPPVARCHNITVNLNAAGNVQVVPSQIDGNGPAPSFNPKSSDNCGLNSYNQGLTFQGPHPLFSNDISRNYTCANLGPNAITLIVTDVSGNTSTCNATITVRDITPPAFNCPANFNVPKGPLCTNILTDITAGIPVTDACGPITLTQNPAPGTVIASDVNSLPVTVTATDGSGNSSSCTTTVTFTDQTPPVLVNCPANITVTTGVGNTDCNAPATWTPPTATDNCSPALGATTITSTHTPGQLFFAGVTTVTYTATDAAGNTSTCSFTVTVIENTLPTITCNSPGNKTVNANNGSCGYLHTGTAWDASGTDNCIPILAGTYTLTGATTGTGTTLNGRTFNGGTTTVTWRVTDQSGNSTTCSFTVTVNDTQAPSITCPATITVNANASGCRGAVPGIQTTPVVSDNCGIALIEWSVSGATPISSGIGNLGDYFFNLGTSLVTYRVSDAAGNSTICTFNVIVNNAVQGSILGTSTTPQNASTTSTITFTGTGGQAPYTFTYSMNGGPVQTVSTSPVSNTTTVAQSNAVVGTYAYTLLSVTDGNGCAGTITPPPTATVTVTIGSMDLTNSQFFSTTQIVNGGAIDEVIGIRNVGSMATTAPIVFSVTNYAAITGLTAVSNNNPSVTIGFTTYTLDNANWTVNVTPSAISFTSNAGIVINPGQTRFLGIRITRSGGANGTVTNSATIIGGTGGGESPTNNNSISNTLLKN